ncbi:hypothetical protein CEB3_c10780 [Peptococcaceae bacterium CEB3]|nr:hypothetical protein CEB3_c10780 [Peptococcaceae bacterium CEB3]
MLPERTKVSYEEFLRLNQADERLEYWLVHPKSKTVEVNVLNEDGLYEQSGIYKGLDVVFSESFLDLVVDLRDVFA